MKERILLLFALLISTLTFAQTHLINGQVIDAADGSTLPGVNILVQGTAKGITSDLDGTFAIELTSEENTLVFSFIGYKSQTVNVNGASILKISMETDSKELDEVVVVGYGQQKKSDITGSTANIKGEELSKQPVLTATQAMQGKVAGVQIISSGQPGSSPQIRVRGVSTVFGGTTALYVVDGVLTDDISNINTSDIVDLTVLKDASAAAIYGSRGANGVIIITTRKGVTGDLKITYNANVGIRQAANLVKMANAAEYSNYVEAASGSAPPTSTANTDWYNTILRNAVEQSHNISISGGTDKAKHFVSVGYLNDNGIVIDNNFKRLTLRINEEFKLSKLFSAGILSSYGNSVNQNGFGNIDIDAYGDIGSVYNDAYRAAPIIPSIIDGRYGNSSAYQNVGNPLLDIKNNSVKVKENRYQGSAYLEFKPLTWITFKSSIGVDLRNSLNRAYNYQFNADDKTFLISGGNQYSTQSLLNVKNTQSLRWVWDNTVTFFKKIDLHDFTFLVGTTAEKYNQTWFSASRKDVPANPDLWYIGVGDANTSKNDGGGDAWARSSYLARLNYSYSGKYLLTGSFRVDGSSRLPSQNRWQRYTSLGAGWVISRESFMQGQNIFDQLKLRGSYGEVGNDQVPTGVFITNVEQNKAYPFNGVLSDATNGVQILNIKDPNIKWENTTEYDLALEFAVFKSKLTGEVNYYNKKVTNAFIGVSINKQVGDEDAEVITNVASVQNKGLEIVLNWKDKLTTDLTYTLSGNVTFNRNKLLALNGGQNLLDAGIGAAQGFVTNTDNGQPVGSYYVLKVIGVFNSDSDVEGYTNTEGKVIQPTAKAGDFKYLDKNGDGEIDDRDRDFAGSYQPVAYFGFNLGLNYRRWDFNVSVYGNTGNKVYNGKKAVRVLATDNVEKDLVYNRWTPGNHTQSEPRANTGNLLASSYFVESGSFIRINNLTIGYTVPSTLLNKVKISTLRVFATSQNLFTYKKYSGFTAELPGGPTTSGIELRAYPTTRTIAVGLNVGF